jgi:hypothetical protein
MLLLLVVVYSASYQSENNNTINIAFCNSIPFFEIVVKTPRIYTLDIYEGNLITILTEGLINYSRKERHPTR